MEDLLPVIPSAVAALKKIQRVPGKGKKQLIDDPDVRVLVSLVKVPKVELIKKAFLKLPHPINGDNPRICLIVPDFKPDYITLNVDDNIDYTISEFENVLNLSKVKGITTIMPCKQLLTEYDSFELRRKLVNSFDVFLAGHKVIKSFKFLRGLGKPFYDANKFPLVIHLPTVPDKKLPSRIKKSLRTTWFYIRPHADNYTFSIGKFDDEEKLVQNLTSAIEQLVSGEIVPGGFKNIRAIYIKTPKSKVVPLYISLVSRNAVPEIEVDTGKPTFESVTDELSTMPGKKVTVLPSGEIFLLDEGESDSDAVMDSSDDEPFDDGEDEGDENEGFIDSIDRKLEKSDLRIVKSKKPDKNEEDVEDEDEHNVIKNAEKNYLMAWNEEMIKIEKEKEKEKKIEEGEEGKGKKKVKGGEKGLKIIKGKGKDAKKTVAKSKDSEKVKNKIQINGKNQNNKTSKGNKEAGKKKYKGKEKNSKLVKEKANIEIKTNKKVVNQTKKTKETMKAELKNKVMEKVKNKVKVNGGNPTNKILKGKRQVKSK